jgi:Outer membrane protein beta-barrel family/Carboxypeptidase regulatory-like domain
MRKIFILLLIAQSLAGGAQTIKGIVANAKDKSTVDYATVALLHLPDSSIAAGTRSQNSGKFSFENIKPGKYYLKASFVGFSNSGKEIQIKQEDKIVSADTIFISESSTQIKDVVVKGAKIEGKEMVDRTVYSIPAEVSKASPNAYDLLKKVPSLQVDYNDNITLNGSSNFIIQVDGKQRDKEYLARLLPSDIETIEIITNPSGKYEGNIDGVINIKLKQEARYGVSGNINAGAIPRAQTSGNLNGSLDYAMGKATVYATGYGWFNDLNINSINNFKQIKPDSMNNSSGPGRYKFFVGSINVGIDYYHDKYRTLSFNTSYKPLANTVDVNSNTDIFLNQIKTLNETNNTNNLTQSGELNSSVFYRQQYVKPLQELTIEGTFYHFQETDDNKNNLKAYLLDESLRNLLAREENTTSRRTSGNLKIDYTQPFGMDTKLEAGVQLYLQQINYNGSINQDTSRGIPKPNISILANNFLYTELRQAAYLGFTTGFNKISFQTTLRVEHSNVKVNTDNINKVIYPDSTFNYFVFLPSVNIMYKFTPTQNVKLTYNRRINRPSLTQLSPVQSFNSYDIINMGNPKLQPEIRDRFQFTYTMNIAKSYVSPYIYYDIYKDKVDNSYDFEPSPILNKFTSIAVSKNLLTGNEKGIGLNALIYFININFKYFNTHINGSPNSLTKDTTYSGFSISGWAFAPLPKKISVFVFANYQSKTVNAQSTSITPFFYGAGARKEIGNHSIGLFWLIPGIKNLTVFDNIVTKPNFTLHNTASFDGRYFIQLTYAYKFNKGKAVKKVTHNTETESDSKKGMQQ